MKFVFEHVGKIKKGEIELNKITVVCGKNNTSKTHLSYAIYGYYNFFMSGHADVLSDKERIAIRKSGRVEIKKSDCNALFNKIAVEFDARYANYLPSLYSVSDVNLGKCRVSGVFDEFNPDTFTKNLPAQIGDKEALFIAREEKDAIVIERQLLTSGHHRSRSFFGRVAPDALLKRVLFGERVPRPFVITSERSGISIFQKELDINRNILIEKLIEKGVDGKKMKFAMDPYFFHEAFSRYPLPVKENIDTIRDASAIRKKVSCLPGTGVIEFFDQLLGGKFQDGESETKYCYRDCRGRRKWISVPLHFASSSSRTLLLFDLYIKHIAQQNDILIIDEPELNLHPSSQRLMARLIARIANSGIQVLITTHSDYIVRELNILMMLGAGGDASRALLDKLNYSDLEVLSPDSVTAYIAEDMGELTRVTSDEYGLGINSFDDTLAEMNIASDDIMASMAHD